jgi:hypothetical protein
MAGLARMSEQASEGLAQLAPCKWEGKARSWWIVLPHEDQVYISCDWDTLLRAIRAKFLDTAWIKKQEQEFEETRFRQHKHDKETPEEFLHHRLLYNSFLYPEAKDGPIVVARVLHTQPTEWNTYLNDKVCPSIFQLLETASNLEETLLSLYLVMGAARNQGTPTETRNRFHRRSQRQDKSVNVAEAEASATSSHSGSSASSDTASVSGTSEAIQLKKAHAIQNSKRGDAAKSCLPQ